MARVTYVKSAQQRYKTVPVLNEDGTQKITPVTRKSGAPKTTKKGKPVELRVTAADKTQPLPNRKCEKCGIEIKPGMPYKHVTPKSGPYGGRKRVRCAACPTWKPSELSSSKMSGVYAAQEQADAEVFQCEDVSDLETLRDDLAEQIDAVGDEYIESAENMASGFGHETVISDELKDKGEQLKSWADDIRAVDFDDFDEDDVWTEIMEENNFDSLSYSTQDESTAAIEAFKEEHEYDFNAKRDEWLEEQQTKLSDEMGNCPV